MKLFDVDMTAFLILKHTYLILYYSKKKYNNIDIWRNN